MDVLEYFDKLGDLTDKLWKAIDYDEERFPEVAVQALGEQIPYGKVEPFDVIRWILNARSLPHQLDMDADFGQPPVSVYFDGRIRIDVYFWMDATTAIHEHGFAGAFSVLGGSSLHSTFSFKTEHKYSRQLNLGKLELTEAQVLEPGHIQAIHPGEGFIHSLFHLEHPSVTVVIRSDTPWHLPQFSYWWPNIALVPPDKQSDHLRRKLQAARLLVRQDHPDLHPLMMETLPGCDPLSMLLIMDVARSWYSKYPVQLKEVLRAMSASQPRLVRAMLPAFRYLTSSSEIIALRGRFTEPDIRYLMALLLNFHRGDEIVAMMARRFPDRDPMDATLDQIALLQGGEHSEVEENALGFELDGVKRATLRAMLEGLGREQVIERVAADTSLSEQDRSHEQVNDCFDALRMSPPLAIALSELK